jgi:transglutaminase-like putative cysteine protease
MTNLNIMKNRNRMWDWLSVILLMIILQIAAARLVATLWTLDLSLVMVVTLLGTIIGLALGKSVFNRFWVFILAVAYGLILIPWQLSLTLDPEIKWLNRLINIWGRLNIIVQELLTRKPITDNLLFLLLMAVLFWAISTYAGVVMIREANPWKIIIPAGITAFVINSFDPLITGRSLYLAFYLLFALLLIARTVYINNTAKWKLSRTHTPPDIGFDLSRVALVLSMILIFFSWNIPVLADTFQPVAQVWQTTARPWITLKDRLSFMFASLQASATTVHNFYTDTLSLGLGSSLSERIMMEVQAPTNPLRENQYYWEVRSYDTYDKNAWSTSIQTPHALTPDSKDLNQPGVDVRPVVTFTFIPHDTISNIYTVSEPLWASLPTQAYMQVNPDGTVNLSVLMSKGYIRPGEQYQVRSAIDGLTVKQLKEAGSDYPAWVVDKYLQLSDTITPRTKDLANSIASGLTNPYDIVNAVTQYLRTNIQYDLSIDPPPGNQERLDWFLFDYRKGFCNYYASAEVILLRSLGIPARLTVGFAQGELEPGSPQPSPVGVGQDTILKHNSDTSTYVVRQKDAHAWPEVFFPEIGWVIFEPTASQSPLSRPSGEAIASYDLIQTGRGDINVNHQELGSEAQLPDRNLPSSNSGGPKSFWTTGNILLFALFQFTLGFLVIYVWQVMRGFRLYPFLERISIQVPETIEKGLRRLGISPPDFLTNWIFYMKLPSPSRSYLEINHALERVGIKSSIQDTPSERTALLISAIPPTAIPATSLLKEYQTSIYSNHHADSELARKAAIEIRNLSRNESIKGFISRFRLPRRHR